MCFLAATQLLTDSFPTEPSSSEASFLSPHHLSDETPDSSLLRGQDFTTFVRADTFRRAVWSLFRPVVVRSDMRGRWRKVRVTGARHENPAEGNCRVTRESECPPKNAMVPRARKHGAPGVIGPSEPTQDHSLTSSSIQSKVLVTAFFQLRNRRSRSSWSILGSQRLSSAQLAVTSFSPSQKPTAIPAA